MIDDRKESNKSQIADKFNAFFTGIGPKLAANIDQQNLPHFSTYLNHRWQNIFIFINTSAAEVESILNKFKPKSSSGHDQLSMRLIKKIKSSLATPLAHIINQSLTTGIFPDELKSAKVVPIYKKDDEKI